MSAASVAKLFHPECAWAPCDQTATSVVEIVRPCCGKLIKKAGICDGHSRMLAANPQARGKTPCSNCGKQSSPQVLQIETI
jgi:hypothetical protein